ncbi:MAG: uroporphyrinogen decarboxylase family protein [Armatimonadota bacterium]
MTPRERVLTALQFQEPDRVPIYLWVFGQPGVIDDITAKYGTFGAFCDALNLDMTQAFPAKGFLKRGAPPSSPDSVYEAAYGWVYTLDSALEAEFNDPDDAEIYTTIRAEIEHHKGGRGRAVFVQTPGVFEAANGVIGQEQNLMELALRPELCRQLYERIARWSARYAENCLELGADVIHISDDWGMNNALMFRPQTWWEVIYPAEKIICDAVKSRGGLLSLHSDGYITPVLDGVAELGFRVVHPVQESAGMNPAQVKRDYYGRLGIYGGLDVRTMLGRGLPREQLADEIRRVMQTLKPGGGYIFCTSHMVQPGTPLEEVEFAYRVAYDEARY